MPTLADACTMGDLDGISSSVFGSHPSEPVAPDPFPPTEANGVTFVGARRYGGDHGCDERGRVPIGMGFASEDGALDLCSRCFEPQRDEPMRAPTPDDQQRFARAGIGTGGHPVTLHASTAADVEEVQRLVGKHDVRRVLVHSDRPLPDDRRIVAPTSIPGSHRSSETMSIRAFELQLRGLAYGPPMDPDLVARIEAASDERGVVRDAALADEYHAALIEQSAALDGLLGRPEPVIESGSVFPSFPDEDPLGPTR